MFDGFLIDEAFLIDIGGSGSSNKDDDFLDENKGDENVSVGTDGYCVISRLGDVFEMTKGERNKGDKDFLYTLFGFRIFFCFISFLNWSSILRLLNNERSSCFNLSNWSFIS